VNFTVLFSRCPPIGFSSTAAFWVPLLVHLTKLGHTVRVLVGHLGERSTGDWYGLDWRSVSELSVDVLEKTDVFVVESRMGWKAANLAAGQRKPLVLLTLAPEFDLTLPRETLVLAPCAWVLNQSGWTGYQMVVWPGSLPANSGATCSRLFFPGPEDWWELATSEDRLCVAPGHPPIPSRPLRAPMISCEQLFTEGFLADTVCLGDPVRDAWAGVYAAEHGFRCLCPDHPLLRALLGEYSLYYTPGCSWPSWSTVPGRFSRKRPSVCDFLDAVEALLKKSDPGKKIWVLASEAHYLRHMAPVWKALPGENRGPVLVNTDRVGRFSGFGVPVYPVDGYPQLGRQTPVLVASGADLEACRRQRVPTILMEHGAGQTYAPGNNRGYAGGPGRETVVLYLAPGPHPANKHRQAWPTSRVAEVGCPWLDRWVGYTPQEHVNPVIVLTWHWDGRGVCPEASSGFWFFRAALPRLTERYTVLGHGHPRILEQIRPIYQELGIDVLETAEEVLEHGDLLVGDNTSLLFEFAATGRPVVVLNPPQYRKTVHHGLRFWEAAGVGIQCDSPMELVHAVERALQDPPEVREERKRALSLVYSRIDGGSSVQAAQEVLAILCELPEPTAPESRKMEDAMDKMVEVEVRKPFDAGPEKGVVQVGERFLVEESRALKLKERRLVYVLGAVEESQTTSEPAVVLEEMRPSPVLPEDFPSVLLPVEEPSYSSAEALPDVAEELRPAEQLWCTYPGCTRGPFKTARGLEIHMRVHTRNGA
jgi:hypothetical protein